MIRNSWKVVVLRAWWDFLGEVERPPCTQVVYEHGVLYLIRHGTRYNVDRMKQRGKL